jgi:hypothetical protein
MERQVLMRNFIKYSKLKLRDRPESCTPVGPNFASAGTHKVCLAGTQLVFRTPRHDPAPFGKTPQIRMWKDYPLTSGGRAINWNVQPSQSWQHTEIFFRQWSFCGPWFTGYMGRTSCYLEVIELTEPNSTANYGREVVGKDNGEMNYIGPLNWSIVDQVESPTVQFDSENTFGSADLEHHIFIPVSRSHIAHFSFNTVQSASGTREQVDKQVDPAPFKALVDNIVGSIRVTLSPEAQADWDEIKKNNPGARVSETCAPLKWPADVDKDGLTILEYDPKRYA